MVGYSEIIMEHYTSPSNRRVLANASATGRASFDSQPPFVTLYLRIEQDRVVEATFEAWGCGVTIAAGSMLTELLLGRTLSEARMIDETALAQALDGVPEYKRHSVQITLAALRNALGQLAT